MSRRGMPTSDSEANVGESLTLVCVLRAVGRGVARSVARGGRRFVAWQAPYLEKIAGALLDGMI